MAVQRATNASNSMQDIDGTLTPKWYIPGSDWASYSGIELQQAHRGEQIAVSVR